MMQKIAQNLHKFSFRKFSSNCYLLELGQDKILIDGGSLAARKELQDDFRKAEISFDDINIILLTHLHYDHCGNISLFKKAKIYASEIEINDFQQNKNAFGPPGEFDDFSTIKILPLSTLKIKDMEIMEVPGHTRGSVCFYLPKQKILFSGDTIFDKNAYSIGRTDLQTSVPEQMDDSIKKLLLLDFEILCPGH